MPIFAVSSQVPPLEKELLEKELLENELRQLRESTRQALQASWDEVEELERQGAERDARNFALETALSSAREAEERWRIQFEEQRNMVMELSRKESMFRSPQLRSLFIDGPLGKLKEELSVAVTEDCTADSIETRSYAQQYLDNDCHQKYDEPRDYWVGLRDLLDGKWTTKNTGRAKLLESKHNRALASLEEEKDATIAELVLKLNGRDKAISSLENTAELQGQTVQELHSELDEKAEEWAHREKDLQTEIDKLKRSVREKKKIICDQAKRMVEYQKYISALTDELEVMCKDVTKSAN